MNAYSKTFTESEVLDICSIATDSKRTGFLFLSVILTLITNLFFLTSVFFLTFIVWFADEEIDVLHEMENIDSKIFYLHFQDPLVAF